MLVTAIIGGTVALLAVRRRRRQGRPGLLRAMVSLLLLLSPANFIDDVGNFFGGIAGDVKAFVLQVVHTATDWITSAIDWIYARLDEAFSYAADLFNQIESFAVSLWNQLYGIVVGLVSQVVGYARQLWADATSLARGLFDTLSSWAAAALHQLGQWATDAFNFAVALATRLVHDLAQWARDAFDFATHLAGQLVADLRGWITSALDWLTKNILGPLWNTVFGWAVDLLHVVEQAFDWLVMLAVHGPLWVVEQLVHQLETAPHVILDLLRGAIAKEGDSIDRAFADWLG